jgi:hypothetical protein
MRLRLFAACLATDQILKFYARIAAPLERPVCRKTRSEWKNTRTASVKNSGPPSALKPRSDANADRCFACCDAMLRRVRADRRGHPGRDRRSAGARTKQAASAIDRQAPPAASGGRLLDKGQYGRLAFRFVGDEIRLQSRTAPSTSGNAQETTTLKEPGLDHRDRNAALWPFMVLRCK